MTDGQLAHWRNLAVACDMPPLYVDRNTLEAVRAAFPHLFAALLCERERSARSETAAREPCSSTRSSR